MRRWCPFRGWWVVLGSGLIYASSAPGMSYGFNSFVEPFIEELSLKRIAIALSFCVSSVLAAIVIPLAGWTLDLYGATRVTLIVAPTFVLTILAISRIESFAGLLVCMTAMRALGPECLALTAQTTVQRWFIRRRGTAFAILMLFRIISTTLPANVEMLIDKRGGWREAYHALAVLVAAALAVGLALVRDSPEEVGLLPDGDEPPAASVPATSVPAVPVKEGGDGSTAARSEHGSEQPSSSTKRPPPPPAPPLEAATLREAMSHPIFWAIAILEAVFGMYWQGLNFHFVDLLGSLEGDLARLDVVDAARRE